ADRRRGRRGSRLARRGPRAGERARALGQGRRGTGDLGHRDRAPARAVKAAYVSPMPPQRSGIADYSALLVPALRERVDLHVVGRRTRVIPRDADAILYHIGNASEAHGWILELLRRRPGIVVLHDFSLHHLIAELTLGRKDREGYARALEQEAGLAGRLLAHGVAEGSVPPLWETSPERFPLVGEVLSLAQGLIVHSRYVERRVRERGYAGPVWRIPHPAWPDPQAAPPSGGRRAARPPGWRPARSRPGRR